MMVENMKTHKRNLQRRRMNLTAQYRRKKNKAMGAEIKEITAELRQIKEFSKKQEVKIKIKRRIAQNKWYNTEIQRETAAKAYREYL